MTVLTVVQTHEASRDKLDDAYLRIKKQLNSALFKLKQKKTPTNKEALLIVLDYYKGYISYEDIHPKALRILKYIISLRDVQDRLPHLVMRKSNVIPLTKEYLKVSLLEPADEEVFIGILMGNIVVERPWTKREDSFILCSTEMDSVDKGWAIKERAYAVGRTAKQVRNRLAHLTKRNI